MKFQILESRPVEGMDEELSLCRWSWGPTGEVFVVAWREPESERNPHMNDDGWREEHFPTLRNAERFFQKRVGAH
ncbi:MAG: hypothetical protein FJY85_13620 [Deltaproteobacteria bacterium]|nr:hypothetical protein [Deltaproteobacteria bacterium]